MALVTVRTINEHKFNGTRYHTGDTYAVPRDAVTWLEEKNLAAPDEAFCELWSRAEGAILSPDNIKSHHKVKWTAKERMLRVLQLCHYDPGSAAYRYHSALNASGIAQSAFVRWGHSNPHCDLRQYDGDDDRATVERLFFSADVIIAHIDYRTITHELRMLPMPHQRLIRFYHGSIEQKRREVLVENEVDNARQAIQIGARLYHKRFSDRMHWLPIPMPVKDYRPRPMLTYEDGPFRIAHSPTRREIKGTDAFLETVALLQRQGYDIEPVLIEGFSHGDAIRLKQTCHATFDSFWLGMQGSGLEAACMGQLVIAGDHSVRVENQKELGFCPYTYAADAEALKYVLMRAIDEPHWRKSEIARVKSYVEKFHSYEAVGAEFALIAKMEELRVTANSS